MTQPLKPIDPMVIDKEMGSIVPVIVTEALDRAVHALMSVMPKSDLPLVDADPPAAIIAMVKLGLLILATDFSNHSDDGGLMLTSAMIGKPNIIGAANQAFARHLADDILPKALLATCFQANPSGYRLAVEQWHGDVDASNLLRKSGRPNRDL